MDEILERILTLIPKKENGDYKHGAKKQFCDSIGISSQNLSDWIAGRSTKYLDKLYEISDVYNVSVAWLKTGIDDKKIATSYGDDYESKHKMVNEMFDNCSPADQDLVIDFLKRLSQNQSTLDARKESD